MKRILIPVDGSRHAVHAVRALLAARDYDPVERVELLTVQIPLQAGKIGRGLSQADIDAYHQEAVSYTHLARQGPAGLDRRHRRGLHRPA